MATGISLELEATRTISHCTWSPITHDSHPGLGDMGIIQFALDLESRLHYSNFSKGLKVSSPFG